MKQLLFILISMLALGALANDPHDAAKEKNWSEMFRLLRDQKSGLNTVKNGDTLLDLAIPQEVPYDVRATLIELGGTFAAMFDPMEDKIDAQELTPAQLKVIAAWFTNNELVTPSPVDKTPLCDGEPCVDITVVAEQIQDQNPVKRSLNFDVSF